MTLAQRSLAAEQMDDPAMPPEMFEAVLTDLARINRWTMTVRPILAFLNRHVPPGQPFSLLDVGFGHGDALRAIAAWADKRGSAARLTGIDLDPRSEPVARAATPDGTAIDYRTGDAAAVAEPHDFWIASQVTHHMTDAEVVAFLQLCERRAIRGWMIGDLHRHAVAYRGYPLLARLLRVHPVVRQDGTLSIARSFRPDEWRVLLNDAGIPSEAVKLRWYLPFRLCVERAR